MKKLLLCVLITAVTAGTVFADPIGLRVYIEGFDFGDVAAERYNFAGEADADKNEGMAYLNLGLEYTKMFGPVRFATSLEDKFSFKDPLEQNLQWVVSGIYGRQVAKASRLSFLLYNKLHLDSYDDNFADTDLDLIRDEIEPGIRFDQTFGFGSLYAMTEFILILHTQENRKVDLETGVDSGFKLGFTTNLGLWGYFRPYIAFIRNGEAPEKDALEKIDFRIGYTTGPIEARVTLAIPTYEDGIKTGGYDALTGQYGGLNVKSRFTYTFKPGLNAYAELWIINLGAEDPVKVGVAPQIGGSFSF
ncbi:MAG: hypothetical protein LBP74_07275 [Treponema sp.]|jgi:hypothetical protein|nr:hypothetical protein [Treponema sp.]